ncbi:RDD family protein [Nocardiopsis flavescens]|uniref:RDD family protein n=1 Tax=Nocardiopsis flavescens TaxID=758803 RepID=A0A1M6KB25_9ACTN|nr:antibiotic resistance protein VanZ [Nocardiopsis flavescens]SHJ56155.1 RDD family protein [Nocardiopsis flavescens]
MIRPLGTGQGAVDVAVVAVPLIAILAAALYLRGQHRRYGRLHGRPGRAGLAALLAGLALAAYAVWPLPASVDGLCSPGGGQGPGDRYGPVLAFAVLLPVGWLARDRFRRGPLVTLLLGAGLALAADAVRGTGLLGVYPCSYAEASPLFVALGTAGTAAGWLLARLLVPLWPWGDTRGWPGAVPDRVAPDPARRALGTLIDLGLWWYGAGTLTAALTAAGVVGPGPAGQARTAVLLGAAAVLGVFVPLVRRDRCTPGRAAVRLALTEPSRPVPASRPRVLARTALLTAPAVLLIVFGHAWIALALVLVHASAALVRPDRVGVVDLLCGTRVRTRALIDGSLPSRLVRYAEPREPLSPV